jgi:hypothetical protein
MIRHAIWLTCSLALVLIAQAAPAHATAIILTPLEFDLTISLSPTPPEIIPGNPIFPADSLLSGTARFVPTPPQITPPPGIDVAGLAFGNSFTPTPPQIIPLPLGIDIAFSFSGKLTLLDGNNFTAGAFPTLADASATPLPPNIDIGVFNGTPLHLTGAIVVFDDPVQIGTFDVTVSEVPEPASAVLLIAPLLLLVGLVRWRGRSQAAA